MNYVTIVISIVAIFISIGAVILNYFQVKTARAVASSVPFLEFNGPISESGIWRYKLINRGPGHAKNIKISNFYNKGDQRFECEGPSFIPYSESHQSIEYNYDGELVVYPESNFIIEYENMTGYKMKNVWKQKDGKFQIT